MPYIALLFLVYEDLLLTETDRRCHSGVGFAVVSDAEEAVEDVQASINGTGMSEALPPPISLQPLLHFSKKVN